MTWFRYCTLPIVVLAILVGSSLINSGDGPGEYARLVDAQEALASATAVITPPAAPTPTDTVIASPSPGVSDTATSSTATDTPTTASQTVTPGTETPSPSATGSPTDTETAVVATSTVAGGTATPTSTPPGTPTFVPTPTAAVSETIIDANGGALSSPDGHATLTFPPGATSERLNVRVTDKDESGLPTLPASHLLAGWQFDATAIDRGGVAVHQFNSNIAIDLSFTDDELFGLDRDRIHHWVYDDASQQWQESVVTKVEAGHWRVSLNHFSFQASTGDGVIALPPILDNAQVGLNSGSAQFSLPLKVAPGIGGLEPALNLTYDSARVDETDRQPASWVGIGWDLSLPSVTRSGSQYFLSLGGSGGEIVQSNGWHLRNEKYLDISNNGINCDASTQLCSWTIRDQSGKTYVFGGTFDSQQYDLPGASSAYRWDLSSVTDLHGNTATYTYTQIKGHPTAYQGQGPPDGVLSAYPKTITYPGGRIRFRLRGDPAPASPEPPLHASSNLVSSAAHVSDLGVALQVRPDVANCQAYRAMETRALDSIVVESWDTDNYYPAAEYDANTDSINAVATQCPSTGTELRSVAEKGRDGGTLTTPTFGYVSMTSQPPCYVVGPPRAADRLASVLNGFGGETDFTYSSEVYAPTAYCGTLPSRFLVQTRTEKAGSAWAAVAPAIVTNYTFSGGPTYLRDHGTYGIYVYRGYSTAIETDSDSNYTTHTFITGAETPAANFTPAELAGRERVVERRGPRPNPTTEGSLWQRTTNTFTSTPLYGGSTAFFDRLDSTAVLGADYRTLTTSYSYDNANGTVISTRLDGGLIPWGCRVDQVSYASRLDPQAYLVVPRVQTTSTCGATPMTVAETVLFWDGFHGAVTATQPLSLGNLTTVRRTVDLAAPDNPQKYVYVSHAYRTNGMPSRVSVPWYGSSAFSSSGNPLGGTPASTGYALTLYDAASMPAGSVGRFPSSTTVYVYSGGAPASPVATQVTTTTYDRRLGVVTLTTAPNGLQSGTTYDEFGRPQNQWQQPDSNLWPSVQFEYAWTGAGSGDNETRVRRRLTAAAVPTDELHCMDGLGREMAVGRGSGVATISTHTLNGLGQTVRSALIGDADLNSFGCVPFGYISVPTTLMQYDPLGHVRTTTSALPGGTTDCFPSCVQRSQIGRGTTTIDQSGHQTWSGTDGFGRVIGTGDYYRPGTSYQNYSSTSYTYDTLGNLTKVSDNFSHLTQMTYDALGRKLTMVDPDMSGGGVAWSYTYDAAGNLLTQTDARGATTAMTYDSLNRVLSKTYSSQGSVATATAPVMFRYDAYDNNSDPICAGAASPVGKMTVMTDGSGSTRWCYDVRGREITKRHVIADPACGGTSRTLDVLHTYDSGNRVTSLTYPDPSPGAGEVLTYGYDDSFAGGGALTSIQSGLGTYISGVTYLATGAPTTISLGNGYTTTYGYDPRYRLASISTGNGTATPQNLNYDYYENGNIKEVNDTIGQDNVFYNYDDLNRIIDMRQGSTMGPLLASYGYGSGNDPLGGQGSINDPLGGKIGNMVTKTEGGVTTNFTYGTDHIHAPTNGGFMTYDANGNMSASGFNGPETFNYDVENRLVHNRQLDGFGLQDDYVYDGAGNLARRRATSWSYPGAVDQKNLYVDGLYEEYSNFCDAPTSITKFYMAFGRIIARRDSNGGLAYLLADHLGSNVGSIKATTGATTTNKYYPFGAPRLNTSAYGDKAYTGQQKEIVSYLDAYYYKARFYSPDLGHFLSADPITKDGLNRYAYARWNPLRLVDPSGLDAALFCGTGETCEHGDINSFENWVVQYWRQHEAIFADYGENKAFEMLRVVTALGWAPTRVLSAFHVAFLDTATSFPSLFKLYGQDRVPGYDALEGYENKFWRLQSGSERGIDTLIGFSLGGSTLARVLEDAGSHNYAPQAAILIQPGFHGYSFGGFGSSLTNMDVPDTRILTVNDPESQIGGTIPGTFDVVAHDCRGHCSDQSEANFSMYAARQPVNSYGDAMIVAVAGFMNIDVTKQ